MYNDYIGCDDMKYYCLGIKGAGMSTLANILHDLGNIVVGYDDVKSCTSVSPPPFTA